MSTDERLEKVEVQLARVKWFNRCLVALIILFLTMCVVCLLLTGCNDKSRVKSDAANEPEIAESQTEAEFLKEHELETARRLGESYLQSAKDLYNNGHVELAAEMLQKVQKYVDYLTAKDRQEFDALMHKIQTPVAKAPEKPAEPPEQLETPEEQEEIDRKKERAEERDTVIDLLVTLNANVESLTCLATEIRDCLQSIEASQYVLVNSKPTP